MLKFKNLLMLALALTLVGAGGCIFSPEPDKPCDGCPVGEPPLPFPDTPDKLMTNFRTVYEQMNFAELAKMLHPQYVTILKESTYIEYPDVGTTLDLEEELRIHERMFSKQDVTDPEGALVPGVQSIDFQTWQQTGAWSDSPANDPIPNSKFALYDVVFLFDRGGLHTTLKVQGLIKFYVTSRDSVVNGVTKPYYQMRGQVDQTLDQ